MKQSLVRLAELKFIKVFRFSGVLFLLTLAVFYPGCAPLQKIDNKSEMGFKFETDEEIGGTKIKEFFLSPGDEIKINVFQHKELSRTVKIPPDNKLFFPFVGEIDSSGKNLKQLREMITYGLSNYKEIFLLPGDEISISVFNHKELNRKIKIPSDGYIFFPLVGEIDTTDKTLRSVREIIVERLSQFRSVALLAGDEIQISVYRHKELSRRLSIPPDGKIYFPLVGEINTTNKKISELAEAIRTGLTEYKQEFLTPGDKIEITVYQHDNLNRNITIPSDGQIFYPLVGEISTMGKDLATLRKALTKKLSVHIKDVQLDINLASSILPKTLIDPQVSVDLIKSGLPKILLDPQVAIDIVKLSTPKKIVNPQVSVEIVGFGGQKVFVLGEVKRPGVYFADGSVTLIEAISLAGGFTLVAKQKDVLFVRSKGKDMQQPELLIVNLKQAFTTGNMMQNLVLQKGDMIYVPRTTIANVNRFFSHLTTIIQPLLGLEYGYFIGQIIHEGPASSETVSSF